MEWPVSGVGITVSVVHASTAEVRPRRLNGDVVGQVNSSLEGGEDWDPPIPLAANQDTGFQGTIVLGMGFVLSPEESNELAHEDPSTEEIVRPYIGGQRLNSSPELMYDRFVINFFDRSLEDAGQWPVLLGIVEDRVKPERTRRKPNGDFVLRRPLPQRWWQFADKRPLLYRKLANLDRCLACALVSKHLLFAFQPTDRVFSHKLGVFALDGWHHFAILQSSVHDAWAWAMSSTMRNAGINYTPSRCFETFPMPSTQGGHRAPIASAGEALYSLRARVMLDVHQGMTQVWNRVLDPDCHDPEIIELRRLRDEMDRAVLAAYGWSDLDPEDKDEILTRLRKLNAKRAAEEARGT